MNEAAIQNIKQLDEKLCNSCDAVIKIKAEICPHCGVRQTTPISKALLLVITFFLGGFGAHKFYTGRHWQGALYLLLCWTGIPGLIAFIEFLIYAFTSSEKLQEKYSGSGSGAVIAIIACSFGMICIIGILAAIAIPQFVTYRNRAFQTAVTSELQVLLTAENEYLVENGRFSNSLNELNFNSTIPDIKIEILNADANCFQAIGQHSKLESTISIDCNGFQ